MKPLYLCTSTFNRHDLLRGLIQSVASGTRVPDAVYIIDHGYNKAKVVQAVEGILPKGVIQYVELPDAGSAYAVNWIFENVPDDKVLCGDDFLLAPDTLEKLAAAEGDFILPKLNQNVFACFLMRDRVFRDIGRFDEKISPGYLYFEDTDYQRRIDLYNATQNGHGIRRTIVEDALVTHVNGGSQTMKTYSPAQMAEHHRRFRIAASNYVKKWGGMPFKERFDVPKEL